MDFGNHYFLSVIKKIDMRARTCRARPRRPLGSLFFRSRKNGFLARQFRQKAGVIAARARPVFHSQRAAPAGMKSSCQPASGNLSPHWKFIERRNSAARRFFSNKHKE